MNTSHVLIIGGGLAGLSTGCYARTNGFRTTILEHGLGLGGVCTAWQSGAYTFDGCIHWLTEGPFSRLYEELKIIPPVKTHTLTQFATWRDPRAKTEITVGQNLDAFARSLRALSPADGDEIDRMVAAARELTELDPGYENPPELSTLGASLKGLWEMRSHLGTLAHYRLPVGAWTAEHLHSPQLRQLFLRLMPADSSMLFLLFTLGYLGRGWLSRPVGGSGAFRDALVARYEALGGQTRLNTTVEEVVVEDGRATGVRLTDGTLLRGDLVVSTASAPETVLRLLAGRYGAVEMEKRLAEWKLFAPVVLASYGVALPLTELPPTLLIESIEPLFVGGCTNDHLHLRIYNDDPSVAPPGHTVVQAMAQSDFDWWAARGSGYGAAKSALSDAILDRIDAAIPGVRAATRQTDLATPLTFWRSARSWRGAFEGWMPRTESFTGHLPRTLPGLSGFYMAGQWVEPGGGVPTALMSGRQLVQILCHEAGRPFLRAQS